MGNWLKKQGSKLTVKNWLTGKGHIGRALNPIAAIYYQGGKKFIHGVKNRSWRKLLPGAQNSARSSDIWSMGSYGSPYGPTGSIVGRY